MRTNTLKLNFNAFTAHQRILQPLSTQHPTFTVWRKRRLWEAFLKFNISMGLLVERLPTSQF